MQTHIAYFIQKQAAALRQLEAALARGNGAGKSALLMTEQLTFKQLRRDRAAIDGNERFVTPCGVVVEITRDDFFAGPRLAQYQYGCIGIRYLLDQFTDLANTAAVTHQAAEQFGRALCRGLGAAIIEDLGLLQRAGKLPVLDRKINGR